MTAAAVLTAVPDPGPDLEPFADSTAEQATIGALLLAGPTMQDRILRTARPDDFGDPHCWFVFGVAGLMHAEGRPVDTLTFVGYVDEHNLRQYSWAPFWPTMRSDLSTWTSMVPTTVNGPWYADQVVLGAARRRVWYGGRAVAACAGADLDDLRTMVRRELTEILDVLDRAEWSKPQPIVPMSDVEPEEES
jgi:replicative DNA helicase